MTDAGQLAAKPLELLRVVLLTKAVRPVEQPVAYRLRRRLELVCKRCDATAGSRQRDQPLAILLWIVLRAHVYPLWVIVHCPLTRSNSS